MVSTHQGLGFAPGLDPLGFRAVLSVFLVRDQACQSSPSTSCAGLAPTPNRIFSKKAREPYIPISTTCALRIALHPPSFLDRDLGYAAMLSPSARFASRCILGHSWVVTSDTPRCFQRCFLVVAMVLCIVSRRCRPASRIGGWVRWVVGIDAYAVPEDTINPKP